MIFGYAKQEGVELVVFFDDTKPNVDAVQHIEQQRDATDDAGAKVLAFHVNPGHPRFLMDTDQDMFAKLTESTAAANVALERVIVVFDFDLTLSEAHTGGHDLRVLARGGEQHDRHSNTPTHCAYDLIGLCHYRVLLSCLGRDPIMQHTQAPLKLEQGHYFKIRPLHPPCACGYACLC